MKRIFPAVFGLLLLAGCATMEPHSNVGQTPQLQSEPADQGSMISEGIGYVVDAALTAAAVIQW